MRREGAKTNEFRATRQSRAYQEKDYGPGPPGIVMRDFRDASLIYPAPDNTERKQPHRGEQGSGGRCREGGEGIRKISLQQREESFHEVTANSP